MCRPGHLLNDYRRLSRNVLSKMVSYDLRGRNQTTGAFRPDDEGDGLPFIEICLRSRGRSDQRDHQEAHQQTHYPHSSHKSLLIREVKFGKFFNAAGSIKPASPPQQNSTLEASREYPRRNKLCQEARDRKSTRLNSSHRTISYAVFCLKKKKTQMTTRRRIGPATTF